MRKFAEIFEIAAARHGGAQAFEAKLTKPKPAAALGKVPEDRWLAGMTRAVFNAGFNWKVIEAKWDGFEEAFHGFDVDRCAMMDDDWLDRLVSDTRIVRNGAKIVSVRDNAVFLTSLRRTGGAGKVFGGWPADNYVGLLDLLKREGNRLGGASGQYFLRFSGVDSFILSNDVVARLIAEGVVDKAPSSKSAMAKVQAAFNEWRSQSGRSLTEISRVMAMSI